MALGLGTGLGKGGIIGSIPGVVTDNLVMKHMYPAGAVVPLSDGALHLDTAGDYVTVSETTLSVHDAAHSFSFWINLIDIGSWQPIFGSDDAFYNMLAIDQENDRIVIEGDTDADNIQWDTIDDPIPLNTWNHFAICTDGAGSAKGYQNGVEMTIINDTIGTDLVFTYIGRGASYYLGGYLCNIGIWERQLTQAEVKSIMWKRYADLTTSESTSILHWWAMDEGTGTTANDSKGSLDGSATFT